MTTLHYILIGLAILLVGGVALYNVLQERRLRRQVDQMFAAKREDVELGSPDLSPGAQEDGPVLRFSENTDPGLAVPPHGVHTLEWGGGLDAKPHVDAPDSVPSAAASHMARDPVPPERETLREASTPVRESPQHTVTAAPRPPRIELELPPGLTEPRPKPPSVAPGGSPVLPEMRLDAGTEYIARLRFGQAEQTAFAGLLAQLRAIGKPVRAIGQRPDGIWEELGPRPAMAYPVVELGIQLADRSGPIKESELDAFCQALYAFATEHGGAVSCPEKRAALELARELDQFCIEVDVMIGLNLVSPDSEPFQGERLLRLAAEAGLRPAEDGSYVLRDGAGRALFSLVNQEERPFPAEGGGTTHGVTLLFDVPRVADGLAVFDRMTQLGFDLAARLPGRLVDDRGRLVNQDSLHKDRRRLDEYYARMHARDIPPGGERALRLFA